MDGYLSLRRANLYLYAACRPTRRLDPLGLADIVVAGGEKTPTIDEWYGSMFESALNKINPGLVQGRFGAYHRDMYKTGCLGMTTLCVHFTNWPLNDAQGRPVVARLPKLDHCYRSLDKARDVAAAWTKDGKCKCPKGTSALSGGDGVARVFALMYSSKDEGFRDIVPAPIDDGKGDDEGRYDLERQDIIESLARQSGAGATNFDFLLRSTEGDPWYNAGTPWLHASEGGPDMKVKLADDNGLNDQFNNNNSKFNQLFYCVACERPYPKA